MAVRCLFLILTLLLHSINSHTVETTTENSYEEHNKNNLLEWIIGILKPTPATTTTITTTTTTTPTPMAESECPTCTCGRINHYRIVGGQETAVNAYPWMTMLLMHDQFYCGGTLINDRYIITVAHCVYGIQQNAITVKLLQHDRTNSSVYAIRRHIAAVIIHERYNYHSFDNDLALLRLSAPVEWNKRLRPICLPNADRDYAGDIGIVTGWGALSEDGPNASKLQEVEVPILSQVACRESNYNATQITDNMLCAGYAVGDKDACDGDNGGPLHVRIQERSTKRQRYLLVGIVSWGVGCARPQTPGVYTRVSRYLEWISQHTMDACDCDKNASD